MIVLPDPMLLSSAHATVAQANRAFTVILINRQSSRIPSRIATRWPLGILHPKAI
jgi:hypothetical protein